MVAHPGSGKAASAATATPPQDRKPLLRLDRDTGVAEEAADIVRLRLRAQRDWLSSSGGNKISQMKLWVFLIGLIVFLTALIIYFSNNKNISPLSREIVADNLTPALINKSDVNNCVSEERPVILRGNSLSGFLEPGAELKILVDYYKCHELGREDVIAYNYAGDNVPIVKIVKAIKGDTFHLKQSGNCWNILINGEITKNSQNLPYCISENGYKMLSLYENDYKNIIPKDAYLILGNLTGGSLDSTQFGLIGKTDILSKVEY